MQYHGLQKLAEFGSVLPIKIKYNTFYFFQNVWKTVVLRIFKVNFSTIQWLLNYQSDFFILKKKSHAFKS